MEYFIDKALDKSAVNGLFKTMRTKYSDYEIHTLQLYKGEKLLARIAQTPYSCTDAREIYSLSKTFTSTVVGIASDMGLLSDEDRVIDYFPEINTSGFEKLKIKHLLSMNTGHSACVMKKMKSAESSAKAFFSVPLEYEPGTHFAYNTGATCLLSTIVERASGEKFFDFACEKLFFPLGITNVYWSRCDDGACQAGTGLHISSDDIVKLGLLYYNKGIYKGKRIISEEWIKKAASPISDNSSNGTADWTSGYGYQIWINSRDGFRGDGAFGQLCLVMPKYDGICVVQGFFKGDMQNEMDELFRLFDGCSEKEEAEDYIGYAPARAAEHKSFDGIYKLADNAFGFKKLKITLSENLLELSFTDGCRVNTISAGSGEWKKSCLYTRGMTPKLDIMNELTESVKTAASFEVTGDEIKVHIRYLTNPHSEILHIKYDNKTAELFFENTLPDLREEGLRTLSGVYVN